MAAIKTFVVLLLFFFFQSCTEKKSSPLIGTWQLIASSSTEGNKTVSTFDSTIKMIKIINQDHFSFVSHDLQNGKDSLHASYNAGAGPYTLKDSTYTEHLEFFNERKWEGNSFTFTIHFNGDTLIQKGIEKVEKLGVDHIITEQYLRIK